MHCVDMSSFKREVPDEVTSPLAVFAVDWMTVSAMGAETETETETVGRTEEGRIEEREVTVHSLAMTIHFSLYEHVMESEGVGLEMLL